MKKKTKTQNLMIAILLLSISAQAQDSLFISELSDPADDYSGRFIELYNAGSEAVDFSTHTFYLSRQSNGGTTWGDVQLTGAVAGGETYIIGGSTFEAIYGFAPDMETGILIGNGDDAYCLYRDGDHIGGLLSDIFGVIDEDGTGQIWEYTDSRALRLPAVSASNISWTDNEWLIETANVADGNPGIHTVSAETDTIPPPVNHSLSILNDWVHSTQVFEIAVLVNELIADDNIISYQFDIDFDSSLLQYSGCFVEGTLAEGGTVVSNANIQGRVSVAYMNSTAIIGDGEILILQFNALKPDTTEVFISNAYLNNSAVLELSSATIIIQEAEPPTAIIAYNDSLNRFADTLIITANFKEPMAANDPVMLTFSGAINLSNVEMIRINDSVYNYSFSIPKADGEVILSFNNGTDLAGNGLLPIPTEGASFNIIAFNPGDVNDDGVVQAFDAALTLQHSVGLDPLPYVDPLPWEPWRDSTANVDGAMGITAYDAGLILQYSIGIMSEFSLESKKSTSLANVSLSVENNYIVFSSYGELLGLNVITTNKNYMLGIPEILGGEYMSAFNNSENNYNIGFCTAFPPADGTAIMKIPFNKTGLVCFNMIVNTKEINACLDVSVGLSEKENNPVSIYPNPANEWLNINGLKSPAQVRIYAIQGQQIFPSFTNVRDGKINISHLSSGFYLIKLETNVGVFVERFSVK